LIRVSSARDQRAKDSLARQAALLDARVEPAHDYQK